MIHRQDDEQTRSMSIHPPPGSVEVGEWTLEVISGDDRGRKVTTLSALIRVGSETANDLALTDATVSRRHLEIKRTPLGLLLRDLGSRNGTWIETRRIIEAFVEPGIKLRLAGPGFSSSWRRRRRSRSLAPTLSKSWWAHPSRSPTWWPG